MWRHPRASYRPREPRQHLGMHDGRTTKCSTISPEALQNTGFSTKILDFRQKSKFPNGPPTMILLSFGMFRGSGNGQESPGRRLRERCRAPKLLAQCPRSKPGAGIHGAHWDPQGIPNGTKSGKYRIFQHFQILDLMEPSTASTEAPPDYRFRAWASFSDVAALH